MARKGNQANGNEDGAPGAAPARRTAKAAPAATESKKPRRSIRTRIGEFIIKSPRLRRREVRRTIKVIEKYREKGRPLPPNLVEVARFLDRLPKQQRAEKLEQALLMQQQDEPVSRTMRRAAASQQRRSGKSPGGYRPGAPPASMQPQHRPRKPR